jgi:hypothetical protein
MNDRKSFLFHLQELRKPLIKRILAVSLFYIPSFTAAPKFINLLYTLLLAKRIESFKLLFAYGSFHNTAEISVCYSFSYIFPILRLANMEVFASRFISIGTQSLEMVGSVIVFSFRSGRYFLCRFYIADFNEFFCGFFIFGIKTCNRF